MILFTVLTLVITDKVTALFLSFFLETDPKKAFAIQRQFQLHGPLVNTEYYPGWLDQWGVPHQTRDANIVANTLDKMLVLNASVNFYMFEGGTNFGFMNGKAFKPPVKVCEIKF